MSEYFYLSEQNPEKFPTIYASSHQSFDRFTFVGSLKSGKSRESTAPKPNAIQITNPSNRKTHEYLTTKVEYLQEEEKKSPNDSFDRKHFALRIFANDSHAFSTRIPRLLIQNIVHDICQ